MRRRRLRKLTDEDIQAYAHVFMLEYGEHYQKLIQDSLKFCQDLMKRTGVPMDVREYMREIASKVRS